MIHVCVQYVGPFQSPLYIPFWSSHSNMHVPLKNEIPWMYVRTYAYILNP